MGLPLQATGQGRKLPKGTIGILLLPSLSVFLVVLALLLPWWTITDDIGRVGDSYLSQSCAYAPPRIPMAVQECSAYQGPPYGDIPLVRATGFVVAALILAIASLVFRSLSIRVRWAGMGTIGASVLSASLLVAAALYIFAVFPGWFDSKSGGSFYRTFFGSTTVASPSLAGTITYSWGGGAGWYLAFVSSVLLVGCADGPFQEYLRNRH